MPRFRPNPGRPGDLVASIVALAEESNRLAVESLTSAARAQASGDARTLVEVVCRLAVGAGVTAGEVSWLMSELEGADAAALPEASAAIAGMLASSMAAAETLDDLGEAPEIVSSAEAMRRVADQLGALIYQGPVP